MFIFIRLIRFWINKKMCLIPFFINGWRKKCLEEQVERNRLASQLQLTSKPNLLFMLFTFYFFVFLPPLTLQNLGDASAKSLFLSSSFFLSPYFCLSLLFYTHFPLSFSSSSLLFSLLFFTIYISASSISLSSSFISNYFPSVSLFLSNYLSFFP